MSKTEKKTGDEAVTEQPTLEELKQLEENLLTAQAAFEEEKAAFYAARAAQQEAAIKPEELDPMQEQEPSQPLPEQESVSIFVPFGEENEEPNVLISVNGKSYLLPRGQNSVVPREVADEFNRAEAAKNAMHRRMRSMVEKARAEAMNAGLQQ